jgi:hypothetical protein
MKVVRPQAVSRNVALLSTMLAVSGGDGHREMSE